MLAIRPFRTRATSAFSLVEAAIVLALVGLVIGGLWAAASAAREKYNVRATLNGLQQIVQRLHKQMGAQNSVDMGDTNIDSLAIALGAAPPDWVSGTLIQSPLGTVHVDNKFAPPRLDIYVNNVKRSACLSLLRGVNQAGTSWTSGQTSGTLMFLSTSTGTPWTDIWSSFPPVAVPSTACIESGNRVLFTYNWSRP